MKKNICIFGGSRSGKNKKIVNSSKIIGQIIAEMGFNLIFGGGETQSPVMSGLILLSPMLMVRPGP